MINKFRRDNKPTFLLPSNVPYLVISGKIPHTLIPNHLTIYHLMTYGGKARLVTGDYVVSGLKKQNVES